MIISIIGFMGSGKSTIGKLLAEKLNYKFLDLDKEIEREESCSIEDIFKYKYEEYFRSIETKILNSIIENNKNINLVLSLGGGTPCFNNNLEIIKNKTISIYLKVSTKTIIKRLKEDKTRPLLKNKNYKELGIFINELILKRANFYKKSDFILSDKPKKDIIDDILNIIII